MYKMWFGLAFAAMVVNPALAQDYRKNFAECVKELGLEPDTGYSHKYSPRVAASYGDGISAAKLKRRCSTIALAGKRVLHLSHPPRGRCEFHAE
jgi:hypothetical protein